MRTGVRPGDPAAASAAASTAASTAAQVSGRQRMRPWYEEPVERATGESSVRQTVGGRRTDRAAHSNASYHTAAAVVCYCCAPL